MDARDWEKFLAEAGYTKCAIGGPFDGRHYVGIRKENLDEFGEVVWFEKRNSNKIGGVFVSTYENKKHCFKEVNAFKTYGFKSTVYGPQDAPFFIVEFSRLVQTNRVFCLQQCRRQAKIVFLVLFDFINSSAANSIFSSFFLSIISAAYRDFDFFVFSLQ